MNEITPYLGIRDEPIENTKDTVFITPTYEMFMSSDLFRCPSSKFTPNTSSTAGMGRSLTYVVNSTRWDMPVYRVWDQSAELGMNTTLGARQHIKYLEQPSETSIFTEYNWKNTATANTPWGAHNIWRKRDLPSLYGALRFEGRMANAQSFLHPKKVNVAFMDGSVKAVPYKDKVFKRAFLHGEDTRNGR